MCVCIRAPVCSRFFSDEAQPSACQLWLKSRLSHDQTEFHLNRMIINIIFKLKVPNWLVCVVTFLFCFIFLNRCFFLSFLKMYWVERNDLHVATVMLNIQHERDLNDPKVNTISATDRNRTTEKKRNKRFKVYRQRTKMKTIAILLIIYDLVAFLAIDSSNKLTHKHSNTSG